MSNSCLKLTRIYKYVLLLILIYKIAQFYQKYGLYIPYSISSFV